MNKLPDKLLAAAKAGDDYAEYLLGFSYFYGHPGIEKNYSKAFIHLKRAAEAGHSHAAFLLAEMYAKGLGTVQDMEKSFPYYKQAAQDGSSNAAVAMASMYMTGNGVERNLEKAKHAAQYAKQCNHPHADRLLSDLKVMREQDLECATPQLISTNMIAEAESGNSEMARIVGIAFLSGKNGLPRDDTKGAQFIQAASDSGDVYALVILTQLLRDGRGVSKDLEKSDTLFKKIFRIRPDKEVFDDVRKIIGDFPTL